MINFEPQANFPYIKDFQEKFATTDKTIFVYKDTIYCDYPLPSDLEAHELCHIKQQELYGADKWIQRYLEDKDFRLEQELRAYKAQLRSINDREARNHCRIEAANNLSSPLYGGVIGIISYAEAFKRLS